MAGRAHSDHDRTFVCAGDQIRSRRSTTASSGVISVYAQGRDYHDVLKGKIKQLASAFAHASGADVKVFVDTAPLMEKPLAARAGLGWQGKHTNLVSRAHGSWLFLGAILTTAELEPDARRGRSLRIVLALSRCLPDESISGALSTRCPALPGVFVDRTSRPHSAGIPRADGQPHFRLRRLLGGLPVEQIRRSVARSQICRQTGHGERAARGVLTLDDAAFRRALRGHARQAHGP